MRVDNAIKNALGSTELETLVRESQGETVIIPVQLHLTNNDVEGFSTSSCEKGTLEIPREALLRIMAGTRGKVETHLDIAICSVHALMAALNRR